VLEVATNGDAFLVAAETLQADVRDVRRLLLRIEKSGDEWAGNLRKQSLSDASQTDALVVLENQGALDRARKVMTDSPQSSPD
jgi:hypothetical protein